MSTQGLAIFGYTTWGKDQGQVPTIVNPHNPEWPFHSLSRERENFYSIFPIANLFTGATKIVHAIGYSPRQGFVEGDSRLDYVETENLLKYRVCMVIAGVAELTLVGGWILHGGATLYYYATRPEPQYDPV